MKRTNIRIVLLALCVVFCTQSVCAAQLVIPGGQVIGLEIKNEILTVAAFDETQKAQEGGLQIGDRIVAVNAKPVRSVQDVRNQLRQSDGTVEVSVLRDGKAKKLQLQPQITEQGPRLGVFLKEGITGVGTVTWYDPNSGAIGALGHGVNDADGKPVRMDAGTLYEASVITVKTGKTGAPGQLMSSIEGTDVIGTLSKNTPQGVFGTADLTANDEMLPIGEKSDVHTGAATIRSTVSGNQVQEYSVEILKVYPESGATGRNMLLKVTDPDLLAATGGIVQGMSGSPIIQEGKLVGAVTHVLVNDPTMGYGIFIENMLDAAA